MDQSPCPQLGSLESRCRFRHLVDMEKSKQNQLFDSRSQHEVWTSRKPPAVKPAWPVGGQARKEVRPKRETKKSRILDALKDAGHKGVRNTELNPICFRYGAAIHVLRNEGWKIRTDCLDAPAGLYKFTLLSIVRNQRIRE